MISWRMALAVLVGGGIGAFCRYVVGAVFLQRFGPGFPYGTMTINIVGCFFIGVISELAIARSIIVTPLLRTFLVVGVIGGFTTFSSFSYDVVTLTEDAAAISALIYICASVVGGIFAAFAGVVAVRSIT